MKTTKWSDIRKKRFTAPEIAAQDAAIQAEVLDMELRELRELAGKTQVEVAAAAAMAQSEVSKTEKRDDHLLSTLRRYVEALGGELEVVAKFGDKSIRLRGV